MSHKYKDYVSIEKHPYKSWVVLKYNPYKYNRNYITHDDTIMINNIYYEGFFGNDQKVPYFKYMKLYKISKDIPVLNILLRGVKKLVVETALNTIIELLPNIQLKLISISKSRNNIINEIYKLSNIIKNKDKIKLDKLIKSYRFYDTHTKIFSAIYKDIVICCQDTYLYFLKKYPILISKEFYDFVADFNQNQKYLFDDNIHIQLTNVLKKLRTLTNNVSEHC